MPKDYYAILGVSRAADSATIHSAFRTLARQYHPDAGSGSSASKFREVLEAYHTLSDPARRRKHDINLGEAIRSHGVTAEPLFDPASSAGTCLRPATSGLDQCLADLLRFMESEVDLWWRYPRMFS